eukprot:Tamp_24743.p1 GENE.Tamp_24743~~Tamp_24743.p1  ORF type:complete len:240 (+),score=33.51 Tamp_24743:2-721(+)
MGRSPSAGVMRGLDKRAEAMAPTMKAQELTNMLWALCVISTLCVSEDASPWGHAAAKRLVSLGEAESLNTVQLRQLHQFFVWCSVEGERCLVALDDVGSLRDACRLAFVCSKKAPSASQQEVSETLRRMGLSVEDEAICPKSGYSIDMLVTDSAPAVGGERSSGGGGWAVEFDGPSHFLASGAPTGATLLKRRYLQLLGHALVSVPYWEWSACKGPVEREQYLRLKLGTCGPSAAQGDV